MRNNQREKSNLADRNPKSFAGKENDDGYLQWKCQKTFGKNLSWWFIKMHCPWYKTNTKAIGVLTKFAVR